MAFQNIYYKRTAATAKACYMCYRPTTTVLATLNTTDFLYTCDGHLTDRGFATVIEPHDAASGTEAKKVVSDEEIRRVKEEWEERQKRAQEKAKEKEKEKTTKSSPPPPSPIPVPGSSAKPTHQRYTLHRDVWSMRLAEHRKKRQTNAVKEVAPRLPMTPRGGVS
ncbi:AAA-ATPase Vps4-associated protein 1-domain-containing protein [Gautieria morchelliformis]|nr:AAA-ATPase Vps4-associated protein 1-domain-containing protein [Gautieria morchelliformis]